MDFFSPLTFLSPELASRVQFGWTISIHIIFAATSIGLAPFLVYFTVQEFRTQQARYRKLRTFWTKLFAIGFIMGTVTGIPMGFMFGTNFAVFSEVAGELIGGPLSFETKMAFFTEAVFLGVMLFGHERVPGWFYVFSSVMVAFGAWLSAFWIIVVNAWMQTPQGFELVEKGGLEVAQLTDPVAAFLTPRMPWMYAHMQMASVLSIALIIAGVSAYFLWRNHRTAAWRTAFRASVIVILVTSVLQVVQGDMYGRHVGETQPHKFAAMEAHYETGSADLHLIAFPTELEAFTNPRAENLYAISIPHLASYLASGGDTDYEITGLNDFPYEGPPVAMVFWSFRVMVGLGFLFIILGMWGGYRLWQGRLYDDSYYLKTMMLSAPLGFVALITGWYVTEIGRQPWLIQDVLRTGEGVSTSLTSAEATFTLAAFVVGYIILFGIFLYTFKRLVDSEHNASSDTESVEQRPVAHHG
jgi:cytochrome d ubiquinol oxidase subunit I